MKHKLPHFALAGLAILLLSNSSYAIEGVRVGDNIGDGESVIRVRGIEDCSQQAFLDLYEKEAADVQYLAKNMSCTQKQGLRAFMSVSAIVTDSVGLACSFYPGYAVVGATLAAGGAIIQRLTFIVDNMPCDDPNDEERVNRLVNHKVCEALTRRGFECNPGIL